MDFSSLPFQNNERTCRYPSFIPENPANAIAARLADMSRIGNPLKHFGGVAKASRSRTPAKIRIAMVNPSADGVPSHQVIDRAIHTRGRDYRAETAPSPIPELQNRATDNTTLGRVPQ